MSRYEMAIDLTASAEDLVRLAEAAVEDAGNYLERDVAETEAQRCYEVLDEVLECVAPALERRRWEVAQAGWEAIRSLQGDPAAPWYAKHRRHMSVSTKSWLINRLGRRAHERAFPWMVLVVVWPW
jgi:hypothetical protein